MLNYRKIKSSEQLNFRLVNDFKRKSIEERFSNPIIKVDVSSGAVICNRLRQVWDSESTEYIAYPENWGDGNLTQN